MSDSIKIGISIGDINGIGPEIVLKSLSNKDLLKDITPVIYASKKLCQFYKKLLSLDDFEFVSIDDTSKIKNNKVNVMNVWNDEVKIEPGTPTAVSGKKAFESLQAAVNDLANNRVNVLVTAPIDKKNIQSKSFNFPGHTEYLAKMANVDEALMFLVSDKLRVGVVTGHVPVQEVSKGITKAAVLNKIMQMNKSLQNDFGIRKPKIAVLGLNPHAGDNGLIGKEDQEKIIPAIEAANAKGITTLGPYAADGLFGSSGYTHFDAILAMYHDQGLIPFKAIAFGTGVNFTAGLPIVRTSPDHGTAFDIAGKNLADPASFRQAMYTAIDVYRMRKEERLLNQNPLSISRKTELTSLAIEINSLLTLKSKAELIFICTHNSRRSTLSQVLLTSILKSRGITNIHCYSGGTEETAFNYRMVDALTEFGFGFKKISDGQNPKYVLDDNPPSSEIYFSKKYESHANPQKDFIAILVCDHASETCPIVHGAFKRIPLIYKDPKAYDDTPQESEMYQKKILEIGAEMLFLADQL